MRAPPLNRNSGAFGVGFFGNKKAALNNQNRFLHIFCQLLS